MFKNRALFSSLLNVGTCESGRQRLTLKGLEHYQRFSFSVRLEECTFYFFRALDSMLIYRVV